jgi:putative FmdB family regulatory protein
MPIYEYECAKCGNRFEILQRIDEKPELHCEKCQGDDIRRVLSAGAFVFKGNGFYATDYKAKENKARESKSEGSCSGCSSSGSCPAANKD